MSQCIRHILLHSIPFFHFELHWFFYQPFLGRDLHTDSYTQQLLTRRYTNNLILPKSILKRGLSFMIEQLNRHIQSQISMEKLLVRVRCHNSYEMICKNHMKYQQLMGSLVLKENKYQYFTKFRIVYTHPLDIMNMPPYSLEGNIFCHFYNLIRSWNNHYNISQDLMIQKNSISNCCSKNKFLGH